MPVIVVALDGLRADALGCYGAPAPSVTLDALATESARFEWAFAQAPQLQPSLAVLLSGMYPTTNGLRQPGETMAREARTLAEVLGAAGYRTAAFVAGAPGDSDRGLAQGFDSYQTMACPEAAAVTWMGSHREEDFLLVVGGWSEPAVEQVEVPLGEQGQPEEDGAGIAADLVTGALHPTRSFGEAQIRWSRAWYAARVRVIDAQLGDFVSQLRHLGLDQRALLIVLGTNGYALLEHGELAGASLYSPVTHVPLMIRFPGGRDGQVVTQVVEVLDLMATVLDVLQVDIPAGVQGRSLLPILEATSQPPYVAFGESPQLGGQRFVAFGGMGMVSAMGGKDAEIYDLGLDPLELLNLAHRESRKLEVMVRHLQAWEKMVASASLDPGLSSGDVLHEETLKQLKSLGYIQ